MPLRVRSNTGLAGCFRSGKIVARTPCVTGNGGSRMNARKQEKMMRYFKVQWTDAEGNKQLSAPIEKWTDAEMYRREIGGDAELLRY